MHTAAVTFRDACALVSLTLVVALVYLLIGG
jgi:hypothetical protein